MSQVYTRTDVAVRSQYKGLGDDLSVATRAGEVEVKQPLHGMLGALRKRMRLFIHCHGATPKIQGYVN